MFSRLRRDLGSKVALRLTAWYSIAFVLSTLFLFGFAYFLLSSSLDKEDRQAVQIRLRELFEVYQRGGIATLEKEVTFDRNVQGKDAFLIRLASRENKTLIVSTPRAWEGLDPRVLERMRPDQEILPVQLSGNERRIFLEVTSLRLDDGYILQAGKSIEDRDKILRHFREAFLLVAIPLVLLGLIWGTFLASRALQPLRQVIRAIHEISKGRLEARAPNPKAGDELKELVMLFNSMVDKIEALVKGMRESLDNVSHDLRTPMTRLRGIAEMALQSGGNMVAYGEALADCMEESERILKMLDTLMDISEAETGVIKLDIKSVPVSDVVHDVVDLYRYVAEDKNIALEARIRDKVIVNVDAVRMRQVLGNLLDNAIKYTTSGGRVDITADKTEQGVIVSIKDTGIGIPSSEMPKIWDRLYRGDQSRSQRGLGLGLSLVRAVVKAHGGKVDVQSEPGRGSVFTVLLPQSNSLLQSPS
jgi:signal transduction histidine kinase